MAGIGKRQTISEEHDLNCQNTFLLWNDENKT